MDEHNFLMLRAVYLDSEIRIFEEESRTASLGRQESFGGTDEQNAEYDRLAEERQKKLGYLREQRKALRSL